MMFILILGFQYSVLYVKHLRLRAVPLGVGHSQVPAVHHKDLKLPKFLNVVHSKLDASLDFNVTTVCRVNAAHAATDLLVQKITATPSALATSCKSETDSLLILPELKLVLNPHKT